MKFLLAAINAKYIHSNLGIYSLKKYAEEKLQEEKQREETSQKDNPQHEKPQIEIGEYTINNQMEYILQDIYRRNPDVMGFSCYIWNILYVKELVRDIKKVRPDMKIWLGGPEVSYNAREILDMLPEVEGIMTGEGEESFYRLVKSYETFSGRTTELFYSALSGVAGLTYRDAEGETVENPVSPLIDLNCIPFSYGDLAGMEHRIIYYESSRGCPFSCSYCLSSIDKTVRFRDTELVKKELSFFLERRVSQIKFVDRTFNCRRDHAMEIWRFILGHDNGVTNFHFEISADLLGEEEMALMARMRPGLIQLEIGVQTTNQHTIGEIRRSMDLHKVKEAVVRVNSFKNIHQHLDLIAGLPFEDYESFKRSFNEVYAMKPEQLQLGFLKVLKGSYMAEAAQNYGLIYRSQPPYEVLSTNWLDYGDIIRLKGIEEMVEIHYNSGQFRSVTAELLQEFASPFDFYEALAQYYRERNFFTISHSRMARYEILYEFIKGLAELAEHGEPAKSVNIEKYRDLLMYDLYLRENLKGRPSFARDQSPYKEKVRQFFTSEAEKPLYLSGYEEYDARQIAKMAHIEVMGDKTMILFDYRNRDALLGNAKAVKLGT